jgi:hypothetical protein
MTMTRNAATPQKANQNCLAARNDNYWKLVVVKSFTLKWVTAADRNNFLIPSINC